MLGLRLRLGFDLSLELSFNLGFDVIFVKLTCAAIKPREENTRNTMAWVVFITAYDHLSTLPAYDLSTVIMNNPKSKVLIPRKQ